MTPPLVAVIGDGYTILLVANSLELGETVPWIGLKRDLMIKVTRQPFLIRKGNML